MSRARSARRSSFIRDKTGNARQTLITRGPASIRKHRRVATKESWTKSAGHLTGVGDSVMIDDYMNEEVFLKNLEDRYNADVIYTYIRGVCISVNPYQDLDVYTGGLIDEYFGAQLFELPPHLYAVANQAYYSMKEENTDQCVLISGESGAGKTEAAKQILQFLASTATNSGRSSEIRDRLLQSNPILEAFGNAKTLRNDNSSRFGKYMEVQFDFKGEPTGGKIINYLLEKTRIVRQMEGERNFHIFYMLLATAEKGQFDLTEGPDNYYYTQQGEVSVVETLNDAEEVNVMTDAMAALGIPIEEKDALMALVAFVISLGQTKFAAEGVAHITNPEVVSAAEKLIGVAEGLVAEALQRKTMTTRGETITTDLNQEQANYARDALAKSVYFRSFDWLVQRLNQSLETGEKKASRSTVMGLLDIYGFEILTTNGFEQICINYCNEKLQQLFIELTLKSEQEEYKKEGIPWVPVEYFNNEILCQLIESKEQPVGMLTVLDDCCTGPGNKKDPEFLEDLDMHFKKNAHFESFATNKKIGRDQFVVKHYAGDVVYTVDGFMDANNDLLFRDLKVAMVESTNCIIKATFLEAELGTQKRPLTAGTQFRKNMNDLMDVLMAKMPSYVRCIKPNQEKKANTWDKASVKHQVKYLGLMENLRVARAGYCYRRPFANFLERYKALCPETWPNYTGSPMGGVKLLAEHFSGAAVAQDPSPWVKPTHHLGLAEGEIAVGRSKVFIRDPKSVTAIEMAFQKHKNYLASKVIAAWKGKKQFEWYKEYKAATKIAAHWRGLVQRRVYQKMKPGVLISQKFARVILARQEQEKRAIAAQKIRKFIKGFSTRNEAENEVNTKFVQLAKRKWLERLVKNLPTTVLDTTWISNAITPQTCKEASEMLKSLVHTNICRKYRLSLSAEQQKQLTLKLAAETIFRGKKANYTASVGLPFTTNRIEDIGGFTGASEAFAKVKTPEETIVYSTLLHKFDRSSLKHKRDHVVILTETHIRVFGDAPKFKEKFALPLPELAGIEVSDFSDGIIVISTPGGKGPDKLKGDKGDFIFDTPHVIEFATMIAVAIGVKPGPSSPAGEQFHGVTESVASTISFGKILRPTLSVGKPKGGTIKFAVGDAEYAVIKEEKQKVLLITAPETLTTAAFAGRVRSSLRNRASSTSPRPSAGGKASP